MSAAVPKRQSPAQTTLQPQPHPQVCTASSSLVGRPALGLEPSAVPLGQLPSLIARVGTRRAQQDSKWAQGPQLVASAIGTELPATDTPRSFPAPRPTEQPCETQKRRNRGSCTQRPLTVSQLLLLLSTRGQHRGPQVFYLIEKEGPVRRPYDLRVVAPSEAGSEYYIFCRGGVIHVTQSGYGGMTSLAQWYREAVYWTALQQIPFFRLFTLRKAFCWWRVQVRRSLFLQRCRELQRLTLTDCSLLREALLLFNTAMEEVQGSEWLPPSGLYTLQDFTNTLQNQKHLFQRKLAKISQTRHTLLQMVQDESQESYRRLQGHVELAQQAKYFSESIYLHVTHLQQLQRVLRRAQNSCCKLPSFVQRVNYMTVHCVVSTYQRDVPLFIHKVLQTLVLHTELSMSAEGQLTVEPALPLFQAPLKDLLTLKDFLLQAWDTCGFFNKPLAQDVVYSSASDLDFNTPSLTFNSQKSHHSVTGQEFCCCLLARQQEQHPDASSRQPGTPSGQPGTPSGQPGTSSGQPGTFSGQPPSLPGQPGTRTFDLSLSRELLEWTLRMYDMSQPAGAAERLLQEESGLGWLYGRFSWLLEVHRFVEAWGLCGPLGGQCVQVYRDNILIVHQWLDALHSVSPSVSSPKQLFSISCTSITHKLEHQLKIIDEGILKQLVEQVQVCSESLISELRRPAADLHLTGQNFPQYALKVKQWFSLWAELYQKLDSTHSLQELIVTHYRGLNEEERACSDQVESSWNSFLLLLKDAEMAVCQGLPVHRQTLDIIFSFVFCDLTQMVSQLSQGVYLDPEQKASDMASKLRVMYTHVQTRWARLEQLRDNCNSLQEMPKDLSGLSRQIQKVKARTQLWEALASCNAWREDCQHMLFTEMDVVRAKAQLEERRRSVLLVSTDVPPGDALLLRTLNELEQQRHQLELITQLKEPCLKHKHWLAILRGLTLSHVKVHELAVGHLLSYSLEQHSSLLSKVCREADVESDMERDFQNLQKQWTEKRLTLEGFSLTSAELQGDAGARRQLLWTVTDLEVHLAEAQLHLVILSDMLKSPFSADFRTKLADWLQLMQKLGNVLQLFLQFQQMWRFLIKVLHNPSICISQTDLLALFQPVETTFEQVIRRVSKDPRVLSLVASDTALHSDALCHALSSGLTAVDAVSGPMGALLDSLRTQCARLWFLSDRELVELFSTTPSPSSMLRFVRRLFPGVRELRGGAVCSDSQASLKVWGVLGSLQECITFVSPVEPRLDAALWLRDFDQKLHLSMVERMRECSELMAQLGPHLQVLSVDKRLVETTLSKDVTKRTLNILALLAAQPSQCLLVAEEAMWCRVFAECFPHPIKMNNLKFFLRTRISVLGRLIRDRMVQEKVSGLTPACVRQFLRALVQVTMNQLEHISRLQKVDGLLYSSFEWLSSIKYNLSVDESQQSFCFVDVLNQRLHYGYEYVGSEDWIIPQTPSMDRARLGILLALSNFRCGLVNGPCKTSKKNLIVQLAMALGRLAFVLECGPSVRRVTVENLLHGSLQMGAWLVLDSADLLSDKVSTALGQLLINIHESFTRVTEAKMSEGRVHPTCNLLIADKDIHTSYNYGCVLVPSKMQDFPEDFQVASRPVALTHPDYKVIAEVMLTSLGFVDATYLSQRLVSLIMFAEEGLCLPGSKTKNDSCFFLILQNIIASSEPYLEQCRRQRNVSEVNAVVFKVVQSLMEEAAVVKSILSVLLPWTHELNKVLEFQKILKDIFPVVCQFQSLEHYLEEREKDIVKAAIVDVLQTLNLQPDTGLIYNALTVYQNLKFGRAVILTGPCGSGKTSCYSVLAGALNALATKSEQSTAPSRRFVKPEVLFPNSMSFEELFGHDCEQRGWQDGALTTLLRGCGRAVGVVNWLILDGEDPRSPAGEPKWTDTIATLCHYPGPFLTLASREKLMPPREHLQVFLEVSDLSTACPSALTTCSLVHFIGTELWKAVWKSQMNEIYLKHHLDKVVVEMWESLAEDLFPATLHLLRADAMTPCNPTETGSPRRAPEGLQEVMSFSRILTALVQHFEVCLMANTSEDSVEPDSRGSSSDGNDTKNSPENKARMLAQNCFLVAYSWGFGGHLHSSMWPRFHCVAQDVLGKCRYHIQIPEGESVFEYFFTSDSRVCLQTTALAGHISPKYGVYTHLLHILLKARQPVLLTGEPGSGKSTMCRGVPSFTKPSVTLSGSAVLSPSDLFTVFCHAARPSNGPTNGPSNEPTNGPSNGPSNRPSNLLLFVDDLHQAVSDAAGKTSRALEVLRQSISTGSVVMFSQSSLRPLSTSAISYLCTSCAPPHGPALSPRLTRLFSVLTLPSLTPDVITSIYSPGLQLWVTPLVQNASQMASCIISATHSLYSALQEHFRCSVSRNYLLFSIRDLQKVFQGMVLWRSDGESKGPVFSQGVKMLVTIMKLWLHECTHTFLDRVYEADQHTAVDNLMANIATAHFGSMLEQSHTLQGSENTSSSERHLSMSCLRTLVLDYLRNFRSNVVYCPEVSGLLSTGQKTCKGIPYKEYSLDVLTEAFNSFLHTQVYKDSPHRVGKGFLHTYTVHLQRARQLAHIFRLLQVPGAHAALLASDSGTGRKSTVRCAALLAGCDLLELHLGNQRELSAVLREASNRSRVQGTRVMLLVHQDVSAEVRERLLVVMAQGGPGRHTQQQLAQHISTVTATSLSQRYQLDHWMLERFLGQIHKNIHIFLLLNDFQASSQWNTQMMRVAWQSCCVEVYHSWSYQTLVSTAARCLQTCPNSAFVGASVSSVAEVMTRVHLSACQHASAQLIYQPFTPSTYLTFMEHFCDLYQLLHSRALQQNHRAAAVVSGLEEMSSIALERLLTQKEKTQRTQQEGQAALEAITEQERRLRDALDTCAQEESRLTGLERDMQQIQIRVQAAQEAWLRRVCSLELSVLEEVRGYRDPPRPVVLVLDAVCLLFQRPPGWDSAKHLLSKDNFFKELEYFDPRSVSQQQLHQLGALLHRADFDPLVVREASQACESLCHWVLAVYDCCRSQQHTERGRRLEVQAAGAQQRLHQAKRQKEDALNRLKTLRLQLRSLQEQLDKQRAELQRAEGCHRQAACTLAEFGHCASVWKEHTQKAALMLEALPRDALLTAATLSYLGPFGADTRSELVTKWFSGGPVSTPLQDPLARVLGVGERRLRGVALSSLLLSLLLWDCTRDPQELCPLLVDPHHRLDANPACCFIGEQTQALLEFEVQLSADDPDLLERLEQAKVTGARVLVRDAERAPSCPRLLSLLSTPSHRRPPNVCPVFYTIVPAHRLTAELPGPLLRRLRVVDLSLSSEEMESFIQTRLLLPDSSALLRQQRRLQQSWQRLTKQLISAELPVTDYIAEREGPLLGDAGFADKVHVFHEEWQELQRELQQVEGALCECSEVLSSSRPLFALTALMYRALQQVAVLSPAYCFSLEGFLSVMKGALSGRAGELGAHCPVPTAIVEELCQKVVAQVLMSYGPRLFKKHTQVLRLLLSVALLQHRQLCSSAESQAFLQGLAGPQTCAETCPEPCPQTCPEWIPAHVRPQLWCLEQLPAFRGVLSSLCSAPGQWQEYLGVPCTVTGLVPFSPFTGLSLLQRALLWRTLRPESLSNVAEDIAACLLSESPHCGDLQALSQLLLKHSGPVILTSACPCGTQPLQLITQLALREQVCLKVICPWEQSSIVSALKAAPKEGLWLVFKSCHLLGRWDRQLLAEVNRLILSLKGSIDAPGRRLQLWFLAPQERIQLIPFVVRVQSLGFVCDSSLTLTEEETRSLPELHRGAFLRCALFHSVLLQRQSAQSHCYHWTDTDLLVLGEAYSAIAALCSDHTEALQVLAVRLVHGGHVLDTADLEELRCVALTYLLPGPHRHRDAPASLSYRASSREGRCPGFGGVVGEELLLENSQRLDVLLRASQSPPRRSGEDMSAVSPLGREESAVSPLQRLWAVQAYMKVQLQKCRTGAVCSGPLQDYLQAEWDTLWSAVSSQVSLACQSPPTQSELQVLETRARLLSSYLWPQGCSDPAQAYRLSAFTNPTGLLLAIRRHCAHVQQKNVSDIRLLFQVLADTASPTSSPPESVYLCGLELRGGAAWDPKVGAICNSRSASNPLPLLYVRPAPPLGVNPLPPSAEEPLPPLAKEPLPPSAEEPLVPSAEEPLPSSAEDPAALTYQCPLYVQPGGLSLGQELVVWVPLRSRLRPEACALRRVRIMSTL